MSSRIPEQFTGMAAFTTPQTSESMDLRPYSYTPRKFTEQDVVVKVICCGLCGSDSGGICSAGAQVPAIFGHEIVGRVVRAGTQSGRRIGERVGFGAQQASCHACPNCEGGHENFCPNKAFSIQSPLPSEIQPYAQGGFADYFIGEGAFAIPIPNALDSSIAAPLLCAGVTVFGPMKYAQIGPGSRVGVIGLGGLGHLGVQFAKALGAEIWVLSTSDHKRADAIALGATDIIATGNKQAVLAKYRGFFDLLLSTSGAPGQPYVELYLPMLRFRGELVLLGLSSDKLVIGLAELQAKKVTGWSTGSPADIRDMLEVASTKGVKTWIEERSMSELGQAVVDFTKNRARYRYVMVNPELHETTKA